MNKNNCLSGGYNNCYLNNFFNSEKIFLEIWKT